MEALDVQLTNYYTNQPSLLPQGYYHTAQLYTIEGNLNPWDMLYIYSARAKKKEEKLFKKKLIIGELDQIIFFCFSLK